MKFDSATIRSSLNRSGNQIKVGLGLVLATLLGLVMAGTALVFGLLLLPLAIIGGSLVRARFASAASHSVRAKTANDHTIEGEYEVVR